MWLLPPKPIFHSVNAERRRKEVGRRLAEFINRNFAISVLIVGILALVLDAWWLLLVLR